MTFAPQADVVIVNDELEKAQLQLITIVNKFLPGYNLIFLKYKFQVFLLIEDFPEIVKDVLKKA